MNNIDQTLKLKDTKMAVIADNIYLDYIKKFGYPPKTEHHLQSFSKYYAKKSLSWKDVQIIMKNNTIMMTGYLEKQSLHLKQLRKRWIVLKENKFYCFKTEKDSNDDKLATEIIDLSIYNKLQRSTLDIPKFRLLQSNNNTPHSSNNKKKPREFIAESTEILNHWIEQIKKSQYQAKKAKIALPQRRDSVDI